MVEAWVERGLFRRSCVIGECIRRVAGPAAAWPSRLCTISLANVVAVHQDQNPECRQGSDLPAVRRPRNRVVEDQGWLRRPRER